jgi:hypothetical protein
MYAYDTPLIWNPPPEPVTLQSPPGGSMRIVEPRRRCVTFVRIISPTHALCNMSGFVVILPLIELKPLEE